MSGMGGAAAHDASFSSQDDTHTDTFQRAGKSKISENMFQQMYPTDDDTDTVPIPTLSRLGDLDDDTTNIVHGVGTRAPRTLQSVQFNVRAGSMLLQTT